MEFLIQKIDGLDPPWNHRNKSILVGDHNVPPIHWDGLISEVNFAQISGCDGGLVGSLGCLTPFVGLGLYKPEFEIAVDGHQSNCHFSVGTWIGFCDFLVNKVNGSKIDISFIETTKVWIVPDHEKDFPISFLHLFAGGFNGWERATKWFEKNRLFTIQKEVAIDSSEQAMRLWQLRSEGTVFYNEIRHDFHNKMKHVGCVTTGKERYWMNLFRFPVNGFFTCSPPCVSWSRGGRGQGLESENGLAFSESIEKIRFLRPVVVLFECTDKTPAHPHFQIIKMSMQFAGYRSVWSQIMPYEAIANMFRTRWLAVWVRCDVKDVQSLGSFKIADVQKLAWNSSSYDFPIPGQLLHQMKLNAELKGIYGNPRFLPQAMKGRCGQPQNEHDVLKSRCIGVRETMPTLCASYTQQHLIDESHLSCKGIFAALNYVQDDFLFFSPLMCTALLGATIAEPVFLPVKLALAFRHIGNAIAVPHAVLTLAVALVSIKAIQLTISQTVLKAWQDRMMTSNTIVFRCNDFVIMCPLQFVSKILPIYNMCYTGNKVGISIVIGDLTVCMNATPSSTILDIFKFIGFEKDAMKNVICTSNEKVIQWNFPTVEIIGQTLSFAKFGVCFLTIDVRDCTFPSECDSLDCAILADIDEIEKAMKRTVTPILPCVEETEPTPKRLCIEPSCDVRSQRISLFRHQGIPLATDEVEWIKNEIAPRLFLHIEMIVANDLHQLESALKSIADSSVEKKLVKCMCLFDNHWFAVEIRKASTIEFFCVNTPKKLIPSMTSFFGRLHGVNGFKGTFAFSESSFPHGFCGWELLLHWFGIVFPPFDTVATKIQAFTEEFGLIAGFKPLDRKHLSIWHSICSARFHFINAIKSDHCIHGIKIGFGNDDDQNMDPDHSKSVLPDPWMKASQDPWNQAKKSCKWEDLKLPEDHHFKNSKGESLVQVHRQQISANTEGIAFATKSSVVDIFGFAPPKATALLLPNSDKLEFPQLPQIQITGPYEIVVRDNGLNTIYKRQVLIVQCQKEVSFQLPKAAYTTTTTEFQELVVEIDERLVSKEVIANITAKPLDTIKTKLLEQIPPLASKSLGVFGFRVVKIQSNKEFHRVFQVVAKIHADQRATCLERSGAGDAFIRDYIPKGESIDDLTIVPRFWDADKLSKDDALRASSSIQGFAGLVHTRRGIAVRAWCKQVALVRKILLAHDDRICDANISVIPRVLRDATGWPSIIGPQEVVRATIHGTSMPPIPTRCFKAQGVTTWTLGFDSPPKIDKFMVQINSKTYEIILTVPNEKPAVVPKPKKFAKGSGKGFQVSSEKEADEQKEDQNSQRITALEAKFSSMERRQDSLESRIHDGFSSVNDQLRQVLHAIQPRGANSQTGMTPPPKAAKTG